MNVDELFEQSKNARDGITKDQNGRNLDESGLTVRTANALKRGSARYEFARPITDENNHILKDAVREFVENGQIWAIPNIGERSVYEICLWLMTPDTAESAVWGQASERGRPCGRFFALKAR